MKRFFPYAVRYRDNWQVLEAGGEVVEKPGPLWEVVCIPGHQVGWGPTKEDALAWIDRLGDSVTFYKIGLELFCSGAYFELLETLQARGKKVFADLKFFDIPATVRSAVANLARTGATCCTVHGCFSIYRGAVEAKGSRRSTMALHGSTIRPGITRRKKLVPFR